MVFDCDPIFPNGRTIIYLVYYKDSKVVPYLQFNNTIIEKNIENISRVEQWIEDSNHNTMTFSKEIILQKD